MFSGGSKGNIGKKRVNEFQKSLKLFSGTTNLMENGTTNLMENGNGNYICMTQKGTFCKY